MIAIKSFLSLKKIACLSELEAGDVAIFNDKIVIKCFDDSIKKIGYTKEEDIIENQPVEE